MKKRDFYDYVSLIIAVLGLAGLWYYAYWARIQAIEQTKATHAAEQAANAAATAAKTERDSFRVNSLAILGPDIKCEINNGMNISIGVVNSGNSRAIKVSLASWYQFGGKDLCRGGTLGQNYAMVAVQLDKGQTSRYLDLTSIDKCIAEGFEIPGTHMRVPAQSAMNQAASVHALQSGATSLAIVGHIDYTDAAGEAHSEPFKYNYKVADKPPTPDSWSCKFDLAPQPQLAP